jgi:hypothetical protein
MANGNLNGNSYKSCDLKLLRGAARLVDLGGEDEVRFGEALGGMGPEGDLDASPGEQDVGVMSLLFGDRADLVGERQRFLKVGKREAAGDVVIVDDLPVGDFFEQAIEFDAFESGGASAAGDTGFGS